MRSAVFVVPKLWVTIACCSALVLLCSATVSLAQNNYELGKTYTGSVQIYSVESSQQMLYAGHGVQLGSAKYLLPTDVGGDSEEEVKDEAIPLQRILDEMTEKRAKFTLAMLDAGRDNPFKGAGRSIGGNTRALAPTSAGTGQQALDRLGANDKSRNGLFTRVSCRRCTSPASASTRSCSMSAPRWST